MMTSFLQGLATPKRKIIVWSLILYLTTVFTVGFACILAVPIAWLAITTNLPQWLFLAVTSLPMFGSIYVNQKWRVGERVAMVLLPDILKETLPIYSGAQLHAVADIRHQLSVVAEQRRQIWYELHSFVSDTDRIVLPYHEVVTERGKTLSTLLEWSRQTEGSSVHRADVERQFYLLEEQSAQLIELERQMHHINEQIVEQADSFLSHPLVTELRYRWHDLKEELAIAQARSLVPLSNVWASLLSIVEIIRLRYRYHQTINSVADWLENPIDLRQVREHQSQLLRRLSMNETIQCEDGVYPIRLTSLPAPPRFSRLSSEEISFLRDW